MIVQLRGAERARQLAADRPAARQALEFYASLAEFQEHLKHHQDIAPARLELIAWLRSHAPAQLANGLLENDPAAVEFVDEVMQQVFVPDPCPDCSGPPVVALLREAGHGARRSHVCGTCLKESPAPRLGCVACGEQNVDALPVFRAEETDPARIDACDTCRVYVKSIDLTKDGSADPIADDLASVALDLWARQQNYRRSRPNLLRL